MVYWDWFTLTDIVLPFLLIFTVIYAILQRSKLLGEGRKNFNVVVALVIGLLVIIPHITGTYPYNQDPVSILNNAIPQISIFIILVLMLMLLVGIWGAEVSWIGGRVTGWIALISFIVVVYIFGASANLWHNSSWFWWLSDPNTQALILIILVFAILVWFITKDTNKNVGEGILKELGNIWRKPK